MKKFVAIIGLAFSLSVAGVANASTGTSILDPENGKNQKSSTKANSGSKYSFTLFNFFNTEQSNTKSDSTSTVKKSLRKDENNISSDL